VVERLANDSVLRLAESGAVGTLLSREFALVVEMMGLEPTTPCLQSQIGWTRYLGRQETVQVHAVVALSVVVRPGPVTTAVNGTLVARPARMTPYALLPKANVSKWTVQAVM
jgi:hypothetical protein